MGAERAGEGGGIGRWEGRIGSGSVRDGKEGGFVNVLEGKLKFPKNTKYF